MLSPLGEHVGFTEGSNSQFLPLPNIVIRISLLSGNDRYINHSWDPKQLRDSSGKLKFTHAMLEERSITTSEPGERSCLTGFELLSRHVELWQEKVKGHLS